METVFLVSLKFREKHILAVNRANKRVIYQLAPVRHEVQLVVDDIRLEEIGARFLASEVSVELFKELVHNVKFHAPLWYDRDPRVGAAFEREALPSPSCRLFDPEFSSEEALELKTDPKCVFCSEGERPDDTRLWAGANLMWPHAKCFGEALQDAGGRCVGSTR